MRGRTDRGGWVSLKASGGKTLFEYVRPHDAEIVNGKYRAIRDVPVYSKAGGLSDQKPLRTIKAGTEFEVSGFSMVVAIKFHAGFGKVSDGWVPISGMDY